MKILLFAFAILACIGVKGQDTDSTFEAQLKLVERAGFHFWPNEYVWINDTVNGVIFSWGRNKGRVIGAPEFCGMCFADKTKKDSIPKLPPRFQQKADSIKREVENKIKNAQ